MDLGISLIIVMAKILNPFLALCFFIQYPFLKAHKITLQRYKMIEMQIQGWRCKGFEDSELSILLHFHRFRSSSLIRHFSSNITIFFHDASLEELILDIILGLSQFFYFIFVIQQVYSWVNQILDSGIGLVLVMVEADITRPSRIDLDQDFESYLSFLFLFTIPIFEGSQNSPTKIQYDEDANIGTKMQRVWRLWALHIFSLSWASIFFSHPPYTLQYYHFFHHPSPKELSLDIILGLSQSFFFIQQVY